MAEVPFVSLYRRFRPGRFNELLGQDHVVRALRSAVRDDRVSHAYLFSGPRGTGKTSSARILAKALNCEAPSAGEPCGQCTSCVEIMQGTSLNVHELDAASNNGVDAMRDLVAHASLGTPGKWKVYIVDEVHMLSTAAANALLKTLEEPPSHVVFVLATTDPQKVPPTIRSRTQHLEFRLLSADTLHGLLESVKQQAGLTVDEASVEAAVRRARGSARDALSALDQVAASGSADAVRPELTTVVAALDRGEASAVLVGVSTLLAGGWGPQQLATELVDDLRQIFLAGLAPELCEVSGAARDQFAGLAVSMGLVRVVRSMEILGQALVDMRDAPDPQVVLEIALVRASRPDLDSGVDALADRVTALERSISTGASAAPSAPHAPGAPAPPLSPPPAARPPSEPPAGEPEAPTEVGRRPSVGAIRRRNDPASAPEPQAEATPDGDPSPAAPRPVPEAGPAPSPLTQAVDRESLTQAWGDGILRSLSARAKALFSAGRFVAFTAGVARFALPNAAHRDRCTDLAPAVEAALTAHFGTPIGLELVVDEGKAGPSSGRPTTPDEGPPPLDATADDPDAVDPHDFRAATSGEVDQASAAEARLLDAFPGASEVTG
jgi:DNA polymerase-3 subunit gamma/tau